MTSEEFKNTVIPFSRKLYPMLFRILKDEEETRDALQDLMVKLWDRRADIQRCEKPAAYIVTMAKNLSFDLLKKKRPQRIGVAEEHRLRNLEAGGFDPDTNERFAQVERAIEQLPEKYRSVIRLRDIDGLGFEEIKEMTGLEVPNIRVILSRARHKVKEEVEKMYDYDQTKRVIGKVL